MTPEETHSMQNALRPNHDIFAWAHADIKGIHSSITSQKLNVFQITRPVRQKIRHFHPDRQKVIQNEIDKLLEAGFIREVDYLDWLANVVVVPKRQFSFATNRSNHGLYCGARDDLLLRCLLQISSDSYVPS